MKTFLSLIFVVSLASACIGLALARSSDSESVILDPIGTIDTVKWYAVTGESTNMRGRAKYKLNGIPVKKKTYDKYTITTAEVMACHPCYVRTFSKDEKLLHEGDQVTDCPVGYWKEYYSTGKVKVEGHYKPDPTGVYPDSTVNKWCAIRHGKWTYFNKNGSVDSVVNYVDNVRVK